MKHTYTPEESIKLELRKVRLTKKTFESLVTEEVAPTRPSTKPTVSIVVVAYNERDDLLHALDILNHQNFDAPYEIIFVDNGLDKDIAEKVKTAHPRLTYVKLKKNVGCSEGRNVGSVYCNAPIMAFVDADGFVDKDFLQKVTQFFNDTPAAVAVRGKVLPKTPGSYTPQSYDLGENTFPYYINTEGVSAWKTEDYKDAGGFEASLYGGEGVVLCYRMIELYGYGYEAFCYSPSLILRHDYNNDEAHLINKVKRNDMVMVKVKSRYPFMPYLLENFRNKAKEGGLEVKKEERETVKQQVAVARKQVHQDYKNYYRTLFESRWSQGSKESNRPLFSVIIPCFNLGETILDTVQSVLSQSLPSIEVIVVDDMSTDPDTLQKLKLLEDKVQVIYQKTNTGVAGARNRGIKTAKARYILCLDADDTIEPTYLEEAYSVFEAYDDVGIVSTWVKLFGDRSGSWKPVDRVGIPQALVDSPIPTASCFRKAAWSDVGGYDKNMRGYEDWNLWVSILGKEWKIRVLPHKHFNYFVRPGSKVKTSNKNAATLVSAIVNNNTTLYKDNVGYVVGAKHRQIVELRARVQKLEAENKALLNRKSVPRKALKATRLVGAAIGEASKEAVRTKSIKGGVKVIDKKLQTARDLAKKRLRLPYA